MNKFDGLDWTNCDGVVIKVYDFIYPYFVRKMNSWGLSDGTYMKENPFEKGGYTLTQQIDGANIYRANIFMKEEK